MFATTQSLLACLMLAIVCALAALYVSAHLCNPKPKAAADYACHASVILLFVLVFVHLCGCVRAADAASVQAETFATTQGWGADPDDDDAPPADFEAEHATRIVGPDPKADDLQTWQYNPQNTLVDYKYYSKSAAKPDAASQRLAPVADGSIGKRNGEFVKTGDMYNGTSTRNPSMLSNARQYVTNSTASNAPPVTPTVSYTWPYDGQVAASGGSAAPSACGGQ